MFPIDRLQEIEAWKFVQTMAKTRINDYPESLEQDIEMLKQEDLNSNTRNIIKMR